VCVCACGYTIVFDRNRVLLLLRNINSVMAMNAAPLLLPFQLKFLSANLSIAYRYSFPQQDNFQTVDVWMLVITCIIVIIILY
jgi:hypothetical protein